MDWLWLVICIVTCKAANNAIKLFYCSTYLDIYLAFLRGSTSSVHGTQKGVKLLFKCANVQNKNSMNPAALAQYPTRDEPSATYILQMFEESIREYKSRCFEAFNPLYWIKSLVYLPQTLLFLPQKTLFYFGLYPDKSVINFCQFAWWLFVPLTILYLIVY